MDEQGCPRCKTTKYRNPSLKLLVNICGHSLCESCVDLLFIKGSGACPECGTALRRNNFRLQLFEDAYIEKEVEIRKKILKDFNRKEDDFQSLNEYNDYLEMIETIVFNLSNNLDVDETKRMIEQYKRDNKDLIQKNRSKKSKDEEYLEMLIEQEKQGVGLRKQLVMEEQQMEQSHKKKNKEALIDELMFSDMPASHIMATHKAEVQQTSSTLPTRQAVTQFSTGVKLGIQDPYIPVQKVEVQVYKYVPIHLEMCGPATPTEDMLVTDGYLRNVRETTEQEESGGYSSSLACQRALFDAMCGLFYFPGAPMGQGQPHAASSNAPS